MPSAQNLYRLLVMETRVVTLPLILLAGVISWILLCRSEPAIRGGGLVLQVVGLSIVVRQIASTRSYFGQRPIAQQVRSWARRVRSAFRKPIHAAASIQLGAMTATGMGVGAVVNQGASSIENRLSELERSVSELTEANSREHVGIRGEIAVLRKDIETEVVHRAAADSQIDQKLTGFAVGDLNLAVAGVVLTTLGVILATASPEISRLIGE